MDLRANLTESVTLAPLGEQSLKLVFYRITDRLRSTSTTKKRTGFQNGITVLNSPGTVDADYRGEIGVILVNLSNETFVIQRRTDCATDYR
jgi:dUTP pyrophosphatase